MDGIIWYEWGLIYLNAMHCKKCNFAINISLSFTFECAISHVDNIEKKNVLI